MSASERTLVLQSSWRFYRTTEGLEVGSVIRGVRFRLKQLPPASLERMMAALVDGVPESTAVQELAVRSGLPVPAVRKILLVLDDRQALLRLTCASPPVDSDQLYDRQIRFFNAFETPDCSGEDFNRHLQDRSVAIIGLGGYGTWLALLCSRIGIRRIVGIDPDRVEQSNLNRQVLYSRRDIGSLKIDACHRTLAEHDESIRFEGHSVWINSPNDLMPYLSGVDLVFNAFGYVGGIAEPDRVLEHIARASIDTGVPSLLFGGSWVGPLTVPMKTACYWCMIQNEEIANVVEASAPMLGTRFAPSFAPRIGASAALAVWEASRFLSGIDRSPALDGIITLDLFHYQKHAVVPVPLNPSCPACQA